MNFDFPHGLAGLLVGTLVGITGVGGGSLMTPLTWCSSSARRSTAVGTDLAYASVTRVFGTAVHQKHGTVDWQIVRRLATGSLPAAALTLWWMHGSGTGSMKSGVIIVALGIALAITALGMIFKEQLHGLGTRLRVGDVERFKALQPALTVAAGVLLGAMVTLTSVGAGMGTVVLVYLYPLRLTSGRLVGTDLAHAIPLTLIAGLGHLSLGNVDFHLMLNLPVIIAGAGSSSPAPASRCVYAGTGVLLVVYHTRCSPTDSRATHRPLRLGAPFLFPSIPFPARHLSSSAFGDMPVAMKAPARSA